MAKAAVLARARSTARDPKRCPAARGPKRVILIHAEEGHEALLKKLEKIHAMPVETAVGRGRRGLKALQRDIDAALEQCLSLDKKCLGLMRAGVQGKWAYYVRDQLRAETRWLTERKKYCEEMLAKAA